MKSPHSCRRWATTTFQRSGLRSISASVGKGAFPLDLPRDFNYTSHSITYSNEHQTIPDSTGRSIPVENPATEEVLQFIDCASPETINSSITDAHRIFTSRIWSGTDSTDRFHVLSGIGQLLRSRARELAACTSNSI